MPESNYSIKFTTDADVKGLQKLAEQTKAAEAEARKYAETLQKLSEPSIARGDNARAQMAAEQDAWNKRKAALQQEIAARRAADQEAQQRRQAAIEQEAAARRMDADLRQKMAMGIGQHNVGFLGPDAAQGHEKAAQGAEKHHSSTKKLIDNLKVMNAELGRVPILGDAIHLIKNPFVALGMAIGVVIQKLNEAWQEVENFAESAKSLAAFQRATHSLRTDLLEIRNSTTLYMEEVNRLAAAQKTATDQQREYAEQLERTARIQTEMVDAQLALKHAQIDADLNLTPAQRTKAKLQATLDAEQRKKDIADQVGQGKVDSLLYAAKNAMYMAQDAADNIPGAEKATVDAKRAMNAQATKLGAPGRMTETRAQEVTDLDTVLQKMRKGERLNWGEQWLVDKAGLKHPTMGVVPAVEAEKASKESSLTTWRNQLDIETQKLNDLKKAYDSAAAALEHYKKLVAQGPEQAKALTREAENVARGTTEERFGRAALLRTRTQTMTTTAGKEVEDQQRAFYLERAQAVRGYLQSRMGEHPTMMQMSQMTQIDQMIDALSHPGAANADIRAIHNATNIGEQRKGQYQWLDTLWQQIGPAAQRFVPIPGAPAAPGLMNQFFNPAGGLQAPMQEIQRGAEQSTRIFTSGVSSVVNSMGDMAGAMKTLDARLNAIAADVAYIKGLS